MSASSRWCGIRIVSPDTTELEVLSMSHYPSSAELAAFRRALHDPNRNTLDTSRCTRGYPCAFESEPSGAYDHEREHGIGYRESDPVAMCIVNADGDRHTGIVARQRSSAMRSRAYARMDHCACQHPDRHYGNMPCRVTPASSGIPLGPNGYCWSCWSARHDESIPTDTWTEDEPRKPLPITYHAPMSIAPNA